MVLIKDRILCDGGSIILISQELHKGILELTLGKHFPFTTPFINQSDITEQSWIDPVCLFWGEWLQTRESTAALHEVS